MYIYIVDLKVLIDLKRLSILRVSTACNCSELLRQLPEDRVQRETLSSVNRFKSIIIF